MPERACRMEVIFLIGYVVFLKGEWLMKILVTGSRGFIGRNLMHALRNSGFHDIFEYDVDSCQEHLEGCCRECDFVFHLAGVNRPQHLSEYAQGNRDFTKKLVSLLEKGKRAPVAFASSIQAELDNPYGCSKRESEEILRQYEQGGTEVYIYRFPNVFGKWCMPNYNSAVATFCYNTAHGLPITVYDADREMHLAYIDDVTDELLACLNGRPNRQGMFCCVGISYTEKLAAVADTIQSFSGCEADLRVPDQSDALTKKLYSTYLSYLPENKLKYVLGMHSDSRGSFTEFLKTRDRGQVSVNISKPHVVKGNHWHASKHEIFLVVSGTGLIRLRKLDEGELIEIKVSGEQLEPVIIPPGYVHSIENIGEENLVTVMWANEIFDESRPDTYYMNLCP